MKHNKSIRICQNAVSEKKLKPRKKISLNVFPLQIIQKIFMLCALYNRIKIIESILTEKLSKF